MVYKMYLKVFIITALTLSVRGNCSGHFECVKDFLKNFFDNAKDTVVFKVDNKNKNVSEVKDINITEVDRVLKDLSTLLNIGGDEKFGGPSELALFKNVENKTQIYVDFFEFDTQFTNISVENVTYTQPFTNNTGLVEGKITRIIDVKNITDTKESLSNKLEKSNKTVKQNEIIIDYNPNYYDDNDNNSTDYPVIDYVDFYKDTTNEEYVYIPTESTINDDNKSIDIGKNNVDNNLIEVNLDSDFDLFNATSAYLNESERDGGIEAIFPWIVTIFVKNDSENNQFAYYCDGALLTKTKILTAARCVNFSNSILKPEDILVVLGKSSLQQMADREKVSRITQIITHKNFAIDDDGVKNDLAVLVIDEAIKFNNFIKPTNISGEHQFKEIRQSATTAWAITGRLEPVLFEKVEYMSCLNDVEVENALCATYGYDVPLCPSYGGLYAVKRHGHWQLEGIMSGNPTKRGICFNKSVTYTYLENYLDWIRDMMDI